MEHVRVTSFDFRIRLSRKRAARKSAHVGSRRREQTYYISPAYVRRHTDPVPCQDQKSQILYQTSLFPKLGVEVHHSSEVIASPAFVRNFSSSRVFLFAIASSERRQLKRLSRCRCASKTASRARKTHFSSLTTKHLQ